MIIEGRNNRGNTLLHLAADNNNYEEVKKLVQEGARINAKNNKGLTPFELANSRNRSEIVAFFVKYKYNTGNTSLHDAAEKGNLELVNLLLEKGDDINAKGKRDSTPLHLAAFIGKLS